MNSTIPLPTALRVADYARLSEDDAKDPALRGENVGLQLDECELFRNSHPWEHVGSFSDNDISASAYSSEERPDFEKVMAKIRRGEIEVLVCTEVTRPFRRPLEAETVIDLVWRKQTSFYLVATSRGGWYDLRTSAGRKGLRDAVNTAAGESDNISDRVRVKKGARAKKGMPNGGRRPYGFEPDQITHRESEIAVMKEMAARLIKGESGRHVIADLNTRGIKTAEGGQWTKGTMYNMLRRKRYAPYGDTEYGIRVHKGVEYKAVWKAVFDRVTWEKLQIAITSEEKTQDQRGNPRKYLLAGFIYCGGCGKLMGGSMKRDRPNQPNKPRYKCKPYNSFGIKDGCAGVSRLAVPLEDFITSAILYRLDSPEMATIFAETEEDSQLLKAALDDHAIKKQRLDELIDNYYGENPDGLTRELFMRAKTSAEQALKKAEVEVERHSSKRAAVGIPIGQTIREAWVKSDDLGWKRQIIALVVDKIVVHPGGGKPRYECAFSDEVFKFDPDQVEVIWKV